MCTENVWICLLSLITYLFKSLTYIIWTHGYLFYTASYNPVICYLPCSALAIGSLWLSSIIVCACVRVCVCTLNYFLALQDAPGLLCVFLVPVQDSATSARSPGLFCWRMGLETKNNVPGVLIITEMLFLLYPEKCYLQHFVEGTNLWYGKRGSEFEATLGALACTSKCKRVCVNASKPFCLWASVLSVM